MLKINFANTTKLGFWDFVIDVSSLDTPKLVSGDYKDLRAKIEAGELIDGVAVRLETGDNGISAFRYLRLVSWAIAESKDQSLGTLILLGFQNSQDAPVIPSAVAIKENNEVITSEGPDDGGDGK